LQETLPAKFADWSQEAIPKKISDKQKKGPQRKGGLFNKGGHAKFRP
jgi:hypothetical protein